MKQPKEREYYKKVIQENKPITFNKKALQEIQELLKNSKHSKYDKEKKSK
jgi:hypothetical protein